MAPASNTQEEQARITTQGQQNAGATPTTAPPMDGGAAYGHTSLNGESGRQQSGGTIANDGVRKLENAGPPTQKWT
jgi:hypothetical protein